MATGRPSPRILIVVGRHPESYLGGGYVAAWKTACAMKERACVRILVTGHKEAVPDEPSVVRVPQCSKVLYPLVFFLIGLPHVLFWATHVHAHDRAGLLLGYLARAMGKVFAFSVYNGHLRPCKWFRMPLLMKLDALCGRGANIVFAMSQSSRSQVIAAYGRASSDVVVSGGGVGAEYLVDGMSTETCRDAVMFVGRLEAAKGADVAIAAFAGALEQVPALQLLMVGDGEQRSELEEQATRLGIRKQVQFMGFVAPQDMPALYDSACLVVLPTAGESFGLVLVEAMARGVIPVATNVGAVPEIIEDGVTGRLVEGRTAEAFAEAMVTIVRDAGAMGRIGRAARNSVRERFTWSHVADRVLDMMVCNASEALRD